MSTFALFMLEKISRAKWSEKHQDSLQSEQTTQMDCEVAAGWFDFMMIDTDYKFVNFTRNIPCETLDSKRSSFLSSSEDEIRIESEGSCPTAVFE